MLGRINGFYAFEASLHVFPVDSAGSSTDLEEWNAPQLWRDAYDGMAEGLFFFAEDIFGGQFAIKDEVIHSFDPETGESSPVAESLEGWAAEILSDYEFLTGYPVAHEWQALNGVIEDGSRLIPKCPFVLGGEFSTGNMYVLDSVKAMRLRGDLAVQLRDLPDGATVRFKIVD
ncbi:SMI1/KNR4 family protein [Streptomyces sp. Vc74B-19]|nr:SMI1/KNR4 family protein [Streptomyces sp. Vc74B-19]